MILVFFRTIILYVVVLVIMRFMGKREIGQMQPFEFVIAIMIADLASTPMADIGIPIFYGIVPIFGLFVMHTVITYFNLKSIRFREAICGKPSLLIFRGKIDEKVLVKENFTINELQERLRSKDVFNIGDVEYAILETSGEVNVILKPDKRNTIPKDFNMEPEYEGMSYDLVLDGKIMGDNLRKIGKDEKWLNKEVLKFGYVPDEALIVVYNADESIFCQKRDN